MTRSPGVLPEPIDPPPGGVSVWVPGPAELDCAELAEKTLERGVVLERGDVYFTDPEAMADGYSRVSGNHGVVIGQNGPGISNCVTAIAAAYWAHSPVVIVTPEAGTIGMGLGGFQEANQLPMFEEFTKYQGHVNNPKRMAEITARCFDRAMSDIGPTQLNIPRDHFYGELEAEISTRQQRAATIQAEKDSWEAELDSWTHETDPYSMDVIAESADEQGNWLHPRQVLRELEKAMPDDVIVSTDIGNMNAVANSYLRFEKPRSFLAPMSFGNCGYALPTIIGAKAAAPERLDVVFFVNSGSEAVESAVKFARLPSPRVHRCGAHHCAVSHWFQPDPERCDFLGYQFARRNERARTYCETQVYWAYFGR